MDPTTLLILDLMTSDFNSDDEEEAIITYLLYSRIKKRKAKTRRTWVRGVNLKRNACGVMTQLYPQLVEDEEKFYHYTQMRRESFDHLLSMIEDRVHKPDTNFRKATSPREKLLLTLRFLVNGETSKSLHYQFRLGASTVRGIIYEVCDALWQTLKDVELPQLTETSLRDTSKDFWLKWNFPHCLGSIGGKHINLQCPSNTTVTYLKDNHQLSLVLQGVADAHGKFIAVDVEDNTKSPEGAVLKQSSFGKALYSNRLPIPGADTHLENCELEESLPYVFLGDAAFPLHKHLMHPYPFRGLSNLRRIYNFRHSRARQSVETAFGMMATKWAVLKTTLKMNLTNAKKVVLACCVLHNFVHRRESHQNVEEMPPIPTSPDSAVVWNNPDYQVLTGRPSREAIYTRDLFATHLATDLMVPWQNEAANVYPCHASLPEASSTEAEDENASGSDLPLAQEGGSQANS